MVVLGCGGGVGECLIVVVACCAMWLGIGVFQVAFWAGLVLPFLGWVVEVAGWVSGLLTWIFVSEAQAGGAFTDGL